MKKSLFWITFLCFALTTGLVNGQSDNSMFFVFLNPNPAKPLTSVQQENHSQTVHTQYINKLTSEKIVKADGKFKDGGGMMIIQAENIEKAKKMVRADPVVASGIYITETLPLTVANNWVCGAKKPYEMVTYELVRLIFNDDYFGDLDRMSRENRIFMSNLNNSNDFVMMQGNFSNYNEGVLILNVPTKEEAEKIIKKNPAVKEGQIKYEIRRLKIAKGTFCRP